jgi:hypothetical protein
MNRFTSIVAGLPLAGAYLSLAGDLEDFLKANKLTPLERIFDLTFSNNS